MSATDSSLHVCRLEYTVSIPLPSFMKFGAEAQSRLIRTTGCDPGTATIKISAVGCQHSARPILIGAWNKTLVPEVYRYKSHEASE